ncbi:MAG: hypothetical protein JNM09_00580 [Blastocatellia bacterium]|nr:hypothetical protein [Blastocatellia bacterium]
MTLYHEGKSMAELQQTIDGKYAHQHRTRTPTNRPSSSTGERRPQ